MQFNYDELRYYSYSNDKLLSGKPAGIIVDFFGLNGSTRMINEDSDYAKSLAEKNIILLMPYNNPWGWMNKKCVDYTDAVIDTIFNHYGLDEKTPIVATGGSMGGLCSLVYTVYAKRTPIACCANCPVCDLPKHFTERDDLPRTLFDAFNDYNMPLEDALKTASPLHLVDKMPNIPYFIAHCTADLMVNKQLHSDAFVEKMKANHNVTYVAVPDKGHCQLTPEVWEEYNNFALKYLLK